MSVKELHLATPPPRPSTPPPPSTLEPQQHIRIDLSKGRDANGHHPVSSDHPDNIVQTAKYTWWTFLPCFLFEAFSRASNCYFGISLLIQLIPNVSPVPPWTTATPLLGILTISGCREAVEDYARHVADKQANGTPTLKLVNRRFVEVETGSLRVGDMVCVKKGQSFPADIVFVGTSNPSGLCYDMTANLDGETNLKQHRVLEPMRACSSPMALAELQGTLTFEQPNDRIGKFSGMYEAGGVALPLHAKHLLLRGAVLRNTEYVYGVVAYAGQETKLALNQLRPPARFSIAERRLNSFVIIMLLSQFLFCVVLSGCSVWWDSTVRKDGWYLGGQEFGSHTLLFFRNWLTYFILFATFIPLSLFVTLEFVRFIQGLYMRWDQQDDPAWADTLPWGASKSGSAFLQLMNGVPGGLKARTTSLNEDLALIQYVFSDKTGTLTMNEMVFARAAVGAMEFNVQANPSCLASKASNPDVNEFLYCLALCNSAVPEMAGGNIQYNTESTDEVALVNTAAAAGLELLERDDEWVTLRLSSEATGTVLSPVTAAFTAAAEDVTPGATETETATPAAAAAAAAASATTPSHCASGAGAGVGAGAKSGGGTTPSFSSFSTKKFRVLASLPFTAVRRRQSVIMQMDNRIVMFSKGADSAIYARLAASQESARSLQAEQLEAWSSLGLRTLVMAKRELTHAEMTTFLEIYESASVSVSNRTALLAAAAETVEKNLELIGATAIEDRLQDQVPETIQYLHQAGMKVWVLTGDKQSTAISIGYSSRLITTDMRVLVLNAQDKAAALARLKAAEDVLAAQRERRGSVASELSLPPGAVADSGSGAGAGAGSFLSKSRPGSQSGTSKLEPVADKPSRSTGPAPVVPRHVSSSVTPDLPPLQPFPSQEQPTLVRPVSSAIHPAGETPVQPPVKLPPLSTSTIPAPAPDAAPAPLSRREMEHVLSPSSAGVVNLDDDNTSVASTVAGASDFCVVMDGNSLELYLQDLSDRFLGLALRCSSVIVCRATPLQKAHVVRLVQTKLNKVTLAIGDGANDVSMIQKAHVGVGVLGREGTQAARSSDYAVSQFKHLRRLLHIHGRYSYIRISKVILYSFYKNVAFTLMSFFYTFFNGFTGQTVHDGWVITVYNLMFAAAPAFMLGVFEKDIPEATLDAHPEAYRDVQVNTALRFRELFRWLCNGLWHAGVLFFVLWAALGDTSGIRNDGRTVSLWGFSFVCSMSAILVVNIKAGLFTWHWTSLTMLFTFLSATVFIPFMWVYSSTDFNPNVRGAFVDVVISPTALFASMLAVTAAIVPDWILTHVTTWWYPTRAQILREVGVKAQKSVPGPLDAVTRLGAGTSLPAAV